MIDDPLPSSPAARDQSASDLPLPGGSKEPASAGRTLGYDSWMTDDAFQDFARRYTAAWCSQDPTSVASFFTEDGSLAVNGQEPAVGRAAIADIARGFYETFPDTVVIMDLARLAGDRAVYMWTYEGTNTGPDGTGHAVRFSGWEHWTLNDDGLIAASDGRFDTVEYERQLAHGI